MKSLTRIVSMHEGFCRHCDEVVSPVPRATQAQAWDDIKAHENIQHESDEPARCVKCGGPAPFHDPACIVHPGSGEPAQTNRSE